MGKLYLISGIPGSGKSTFLKKYATGKPSALIISRDKIRFSLLQDEDPYFKYESIVENMFYTGITNALKLGYDVFADQSSISPQARKKLINRVAGYTEINIVYVDTPIEECIRRDSKREGRAHVGEAVIRDMAKKFTKPNFNEGFNKIYQYNTMLNQLSILKKEN